MIRTILDAEEQLIIDQDFIIEEDEEEDPGTVQPRLSRHLRPNGFSMHATRLKVDN